MKIHPEHIIVSRPDSIGDVMLTLPMCGWIRKYFPGVRITFLGRSYTEAVIRCCKHIDDFLSWDDLEKKSVGEQIAILQALKADTIIHVFPKKEIIWLAKKAGIRYRIATGGRWHTLTKCNKPVFFSRRKSILHESQLNLKLLIPLGITEIASPRELNTYSGFTPNIHSVYTSLHVLSSQKKIILHPLSKGSAVNWSLKRYEELAKLLHDHGFLPVITGTEAEGEQIRDRSSLLSGNALDLTGKLNLDQLIGLINESDGLVAASTGPLHIASQLNKLCVGLYTPMRPMHAGRWAPIGKNAFVITAKEHPDSGELDIPAQQVLDITLRFHKAQ